jgi:hypothetical protein
VDEGGEDGVGSKDQGKNSGGLLFGAPDAFNSGPCATQSPLALTLPLDSLGGTGYSERTTSSDTRRILHMGHIRAG